MQNFSLFCTISPHDSLFLYYCCRLHVFIDWPPLLKAALETSHGVIVVFHVRLIFGMYSAFNLFVTILYVYPITNDVDFLAPQRC